MFTNRETRSMPRKLALAAVLTACGLASPGCSSTKALVDRHKTDANTGYTLTPTPPATGASRLENLVTKARQTLHVD